MDALEIHILTAVIFAISLLITCLNQLSIMKDVTKTGDLSVAKMAITLIFGAISSISAFASVSALLIHLFGK